VVMPMMTNEASEQAKRDKAEAEPTTAEQTEPEAEAVSDKPTEAEPEAEADKPKRSRKREKVAVA